ncbi:MAG: glycosyltransferase family 2 protein [Clostridiaceae bacterium]|nr:glycosyltransferase family 2 protein [Clostridiaceae bacterium]
MPEYKATVIVPVYNVERFLRGCLKSLTEQTIGFENIEVVLVNDGSTDNSEAVCREFADKYDNVFLYSKENEGLSKTRNYGLARSHGKYIFFLDSDDKLRADTVKSVTDFFDTVYDEVDLVTYRIIQYYGEKPVIVHYRYRTLTKTGVYDLTDPDNRFITQTNINICIKNRGEDNLFFDTTPNFRHEDEKYCCDILREKMKIGFCSDGEYIYNRDNVDSIVSTKFSPENIFDTSMTFYEKLFDSFGRFVPTYYQGIVFNDLRWKLKDGKLLPLHLSGEDWEKANLRIDRLLARIEEDTIVLHPSVSENRLFYWLLRRPNSHPTVVCTDKGISIVSDGRKLYETKKIRIAVKDSKARLVSPVFFFLKKDNVRLFNGKNEIPLDFKKDMRSDDPLDFMPSFEADEGSYTVKINSIGYPCI